MEITKSFESAAAFARRDDIPAVTSFLTGTRCVAGVMPTLTAQLRLEAGTADLAYIRPRSIAPVHTPGSTQPGGPPV